MTYSVVKYTGADAGTVLGVFTSLSAAWSAVRSGYIIKTEKSK